MVKFIADIGSNHNRDIDRIYCLIKTAKEVGCWAVKFQLFRPDDLYRELTPDRRAELELASLPWEFIPQITKWCKEFDLIFGCTPFSIEAVNYLAPYVDYFKISSYEILRLDLIRECAKHENPIHISTGMANARERYKAIMAAGREYEIYHCRADYPTKPENCNMMDTLYYRDEDGDRWFNGWSDHSRQPGVIYAAVASGIEFVEFHIDLEDMAGIESKHGHVWPPQDIRKVIYDSSVIDVALASEYYKPYTEEDRNKRADPIDGRRPRLT